MFSAEVTERDDSYVVEVPKREVELESVREGAVYRVVILASNASTPDGTAASNGISPESQSDVVSTSNTNETTSATESDTSSPSSRSDTTRSVSSSDEPEPPVDRGEELVVDIESIGDQGDGIARVDRGYVIIVPDTDKGERVRINVTSVKQNVAFGEVVDRIEGHIFE
nr:TRAM domain-containing protein [Halobaculum sp. YSMS11]